MAKQSPHPEPSPRLYLISPRLDEATGFAPALTSALQANDVACVLLNLGAADPGAAKKIILTLAPLVQQRGAALIVDCDSRLVLRSGADGVHLRVSGDGLQQAVAEAVESLKPDHIVGIAGIRTRHDAMTAGEQDIDYIMFGEPARDGWTPPLDKRLEQAAWWSEIFNVPCVVYAASLDEVAELAASGADFVALGDAIWSDPRGPAAAVSDATAALKAPARSA